MKSSIIWKLLLTLAVLVWAVCSTMPFSDTDFDVYIKDRATQNKEEFASVLQEAQKRVDPVNYKTDKSKSATLFNAIGDYANANRVDLSKYFDVNVADIKVLTRRNDTLLRELYRQSKAALKMGLDLKGGVSFTLEVDKDQLKGDGFQRSEQIKDVLKVIDGRINGLGVTEPTIRALGSNAIEVQMPGVSLKDNPEAIEEISRPAKLEFRLANRHIHPSSATAPRSEWPAGDELLVSESEGERAQVLYVKRLPAAGGDIIESAHAYMENDGKFAVNMKFTAKGAKKIHEITSAILAEDNRTGIKQPMAIVLDGKLISAPVIQGALGATGQITGNFTQREAIELANALNNPLQVALTRTSLNEVGPSMAADARNSSLFAGAIGAALVIAAMVIYYRGLGLLAMITVAANIIIVIGVLASFGATLTLPGIAALVLTVGMAVDANILIYERMREEILLGKNNWAALQAGYEKAFSTIVDANVTTLFTALILYYFGTGPIKGFGVTLGVGILSTLFTALIFGRALSEIAANTGIMKGAFNIRLIKETNFDIMKVYKQTFIVSWLVVLCGVLAIAYRGEKSLSIDFTGGENTSIAFMQKIEIGDIMALSTPSGEGVGEIKASFKKDLATGSEILTVQTEPGKGEEVFGMLSKNYPDAGLSMIGRESIGASVSSDIATNAAWSLALSFGSVLLYIALRFEFGFGVGAVVALFHDMLLTVGLYIVLGVLGIGSGQFSSPMIAAILMSIGYSINDKIVVFDRIREELPLHPELSLYKIIRIAVNKTLSRTILTSATTFLAALALFIWGTGIIKDFSMIFLIGIVVGTLSSIFIASPVFYWWHKGKRDSVEAHELEPKHSWQDE